MHNFLRALAARDSSSDALLYSEDATGVTPGSWRQLAHNGSWTRLSADNKRHSTDYALDIREEFCTYVDTVGSVPWQEHILKDY